MISNKDILDRSGGRPAMMALMISVRTYVTTGQIISGIFLMENKNRQRNIDPKKISAEKLNGRFALLEVIALVGTYLSTGKLTPGLE